MDWVNWSQQPKKAILVQFGLASGALLAAVSLWRVHTAQLRWLLLGAAVAGVALALVRPSALRLPYAAISFVAFPIGWIFSKILLAMMFYAVITPTGLIMRLFGRDPLRRKRPDLPSYFLPRAQRSDLRSYLRQF